MATHILNDNDADIIELKDIIKHILVIQHTKVLLTKAALLIEIHSNEFFKNKELNGLLKAMSLISVVLEQIKYDDAQNLALLNRFNQVDRHLSQYSFRQSLQ